MKEIDLIIPHRQLPIVKELLRKHKVGFVFYNIDSRSRETHDAVLEVISNEAPYITGRKVVPDYSKGIKLETIVPDSLVDKLVNEIMELLSMECGSDGRIFIKDISGGYDIGSKKAWDLVTTHA
jgi:nitrogen regulatory protein PII